MREKINRLANGIIDRDIPKISIAPETMNLPIKSDEIVRMDIKVNSLNNIHVKGLAYSSSYRVKVLTPSFGGQNNIIQIEIDSRFLKSGAVIEGVIDLVTNAGEFSVPYSYRVLTGQTNDVLSEIKTIEDFMIIAKEDAQTALRVFEYKDFINIPFMDDIKLRALYEAFSNRNNKPNALEEFLVAINKKEPVKITSDTNLIDFEQVVNDLEAKITLRKNTWGYLGFAVQSSADFIELSDRYINEADFKNNKFDYKFKINSERLHRGKNEGTISFISVNQTIVVDILAYSGSGSDEYINHNKVNYKKCLYEYTKYRLRYESGSASKTECIDGMLDALNKLLTFSIRTEYVKLLKAEVYIIAGSKASAADILDSIRNTVRERRQELVEEYILLEYLDIKVYLREAKKKSLVRLIKRIIEDEGLYLLIPLLVDLDEKIADDPSSLFEFFRKQYLDGCRSPYLYIFYCKLLTQFPEFLHDMGDFEIHALYCMARYHGIGSELARIIARRAGNVKLDEGLYFILLKKLYKASPEKEFLRVVCQAFIKNSVVDEKVHEWYEDGIEEDLQLAGLYENFVYSLPAKYDKKLSENLLMYFDSRNSLLDDTHRGYIYSNILKYYTEDEDIYLTFISTIEKYALEQLRQSKINIHLANIYQKVLRPEMIDEKLSKTAPSILSSVYIENTNNLITSLIVIYPELNEEYIYNFEKNVAFVPVATKDTVILLQDSYENRYSLDFNGEKAVDLPRVLDACYKLNPNHQLYRTAKLTAILERNAASIEDADFLESAMKEMPLSYICKEKILSHLVRLYRDACLKLTGPDEWGARKNELLLYADKSLLNQKERTMVCDTLIMLGYIKESYEMIRLYDCHDISFETLVRLCTKMLVDRMSMEDPLLLKLAFRAVKEGNKDSIILEYVAENFNGSTKDMYMVLKTSIEEHTQTGDLEEKLLAQLIFTNEKKYIDQTFAWYVSRKKTSETLINAFFTVKSCYYFMDGAYTLDKVFEHLEDAIVSQPDKRKIPIIYQLAITKYYSTLSYLNEERTKLATELVNGLIRNDIFFSYYRDFGDSVNIPKDVLDKSILVFNAENHRNIRLRSKITPIDKEFGYDEMRKMVHELDYFIKERILFEGENWEYKVYDISYGAEELLEEGAIQYTNNLEEHQKSRFDSLNNLSLLKGDKLKTAMEDYIYKDEMSRALFNISDKDLGGKR